MELEYFLSFIVIIAVIVIARIIYLKYEAKMNSTVMDCSPKIQALKELNEKIKFHKIQEKATINRHYRNKLHYYKIEPAYLMSAIIRENIVKFAPYIEKIQENRQNKVVYDKRVNEILSMKHDIDYENVGISEKAFKKREKKLFNKTISPQYTDCLITVFMSYSSPKGKVNLEKSAVFNFDQIFTSFNSVSRSKLDYATYRALAAVERGKVTDSLRYDIMRRDNFKCVLCGASANEGVRLHVDHIIPIAKGGKSNPNNLRTLCERCNIGKSDKIEENLDLSESRNETIKIENEENRPKEELNLKNNKIVKVSLITFVALIAVSVIGYFAIYPAISCAIGDYSA